MIIVSANGMETSKMGSVTDWNDDKFQIKKCVINLDSYKQLVYILEV